jgi:hypothetical protein
VTRKTAEEERVVTVVRPAVVAQAEARVAAVNPAMVEVPVMAATPAQEAHQVQAGTKMAKAEWDQGSRSKHFADLLRLSLRPLMNCEQQPNGARRTTLLMDSR